MRHIVFRLLQVFSLVFLIVAVTRYWVNRPITCQPDCSGVALSNRDLRNYNLRNVSLIEADLRGADLSNADLSGSDLSGANLTQSSLNSADLTNTRLIGADLSRSDLRNAVLIGTDFSGANLSSVNMTRTDLTRARLQGVVLEQAQLIQVQLTGVYLSGVNMSRSNLSGSTLDNTILNGAFMTGSDLSGVSMRGASLAGALINIANMAGVDLEDAILPGASLIGTNLSSARLRNSGLLGAKAIGTNFNGADLTRAGLGGVSLFKHELEERNLAGDPVLSQLNELQRSQIIADANLKGVVFSADTLWPSGKSALLISILGSDFVEPELALQAEESSEGQAPDEVSTETAEPTPGLVAVDLSNAVGDIVVATNNDTQNITQGVADLFTTQGYSGTVNLEVTSPREAFARFCDPEGATTDMIDLISTNRPISDPELAICATIDREPLRFRVGSAAMAVVVNPSNDFAQNVTLDELRSIFTLPRWKEVNPSWPAEQIVRYLLPGDMARLGLFPDTGVQTIPSPTPSLGEEDSSGEDAVVSNVELSTEDEVVQNIANDPFGIGFVSFETFGRNSSIVRMLPINDVLLSTETVDSGRYPLTRPLLLYVDAATLRQKPQVAALLNFYLFNAPYVVAKFGYFPSSTAVISDALTTVSEATTVVEGGEAVAAVATTAPAVTFVLPDPLIPVAASDATSEEPPTEDEPATLADLRGGIRIAGSSTVISPTEIITDAFGDLGFTAPITVTHVSNEQSFVLLCKTGQTDIISVDRSIASEEATLCAETKREPIAFQVGTDVVAIVINPKNEFARNVTVEQLADLFTKEYWSEVNPEWPDQPIQRFIPPSTSSAFDLFVGTVLDEESDKLLGAPNVVTTVSRDRQARGITTNPYAIGFMEYPGYQRNAALLKLLTVNAVQLEDTTLANGTYPLTRPILLYSVASVIKEKPQVAAFLNFYLTNAPTVIAGSDFVPSSTQELDGGRATLGQAANR